MMSTEITKERLFNYFNNRATVLEKRRIDEWAKDPANQEVFYEHLAQWESQHLQYQADADTAWQLYQKRLTRAAQIPAADATRILPRKPFLRYAIASCVLLCAAAAGLLFKHALLFKTIETAYGQTESVTLEDGTRVILNANSALTVPRFGFGTYTREVALKGEANFRVTHLPANQKFVVRTADGPNVVVLGTEFTVYTRQHGTKVVLSKGKIQLSYRENEKNKNLIMHPGDLVTIDTKGKAETKKTSDPELFSAWKDHRYVFDQTSLQDLCLLFEEDFGRKIEIADPEIKSWTVSGTFMASDADELLEILAESSGLVYERKDKNVIIRSITTPQNQ